MTELINQSDVNHGAQLLREGELVAMPTETVYGLAAPVFNKEAIKKIFSVKGRPADNPLIAHISDLDQVNLIAKEVPESFHALAKEFMPGPLTVVLRKKQCVPASVSAGLDTIAVRMPAHPVALNLIAAANTPLVAPSANLSGKPSPTTAQHVLDDLDGLIAAVIDGGSCLVGIESTVVDLSGDTVRILRPGSVTREQIAECLGCNVFYADDESLAASPGTRHRHYAPRAMVKLFESEKHLIEYISSEPYRFRAIIGGCGVVRGVLLFELSTATFYAALREADRKEVEEILICLQLDQVEDGLLDRLKRAAGYQ